jgi:hypothetical protein
MPIGGWIQGREAAVKKIVQENKMGNSSAHRVGGIKELSIPDPTAVPGKGIVEEG